MVEDVSWDQLKVVYQITRISIHLISELKLSVGCEPVL